KKRLMEMVVSAGKRMILVTGFKSGFALWPDENATAKGLIDVLLRRSEAEDGKECDNASGGGVSLADLEHLTPDQKNRLLAFLVGEVLSMNMALRQSLEQTIGKEVDLNQLKKTFLQKLQETPQWAFGETVLATPKQNQNNGYR